MKPLVSMAGTLSRAQGAERRPPRGRLFLSHLLANLATMAAEDLYREIAQTSPIEAEAYLLGAAHDSTYRRLHRTTRFCQRDKAWLEGVRMLLERIGQRSWFYREGQQRSLWVLETSWRGSQEDLSAEDAVTYARATSTGKVACRGIQRRGSTCSSFRKIVTS